MQNNKNNELALWMPLIGFDSDLKDFGVDAFIAKLPKKPSIISLLVFNADIINLHDGISIQQELNSDYCNYYGSKRNELKSIQKWTNFQLRDLGKKLQDNKIEAYLGIMGAHLSKVEGDSDSQIGSFGYVAKQEFPTNHPEIVLEGSNYSGYINFFKRFSDGSWYEDYFIQKAVSATQDYNFTGIHLADSLFPPCICLNEGDFSDDIMQQFVEFCKIELPIEVSAPLKSKVSVGIKARAEYVWHRFKTEWIKFNAIRWYSFFKKLCSAMHDAGKKVMVNNSWTLESFESLYRFGIDYKMIAESGVDIICVEDQATIISASDGAKSRFHEMMLSTALIKAYAPDLKVLAINYAKDSTEEGSMISHMPCANEREIFSLSNFIYTGKNYCERAMQGFFVCLADSVTNDEWAWLKKRYDIAFKEQAENTISTTLIWSDNMIQNMLEEYIQTKRWNVSKITAKLIELGASIGAVARIENLCNVKGNIFVPNIDLLSSKEVEQIQNYNNGAIVYTSIADKKFAFKNRKPEISFDDSAIDRADFRMTVGAIGCGYIDFIKITKPLSQPDLSPDLLGDGKYLEDVYYWYEPLSYRKVGCGFMQACANLLHDLSNNIFKSDYGEVVTISRMQDGRYRIFAQNENPLAYHNTKITTNYTIKKIINASSFPVQPLKLIMPNGQIIANNCADNSLLQLAKGFVIKLPPAGGSIIDVFLEQNQEINI